MREASLQTIKGEIASCQSPSPTAFQAMPPVTAPMIGAQPPTKSACPVDRAGLTDVFVTGIEIRWINVSVRPMAIGAKPAGTRPLVAPRMMKGRRQ